jgi:hypothetical protein
MVGDLIVDSIGVAMSFKFLAVLLAGLMIGACATEVIWLLTHHEPATRSTIPPNAERREFNGQPYYIIPLTLALVEKQP